MVKRAVVLVRPRAGHQHTWGTAFISGLKRHGWRAEIAQEFEPADMVVLWGVRRVQDIAAARSRKSEICILERGYVGDRFRFTSVSFGGDLNGRARFSQHGINGARVEKYFPNVLKPWKSEPVRKALILGQVATDMSVNGINPEVIYSDFVGQCQARGLEVRFRPHPLGQSRCVEAKTMPGCLDDALAWADMALTINSNSGVDAVLAGVPCVAIDEGSMVYSLASRSVNAACRRPDRSAWLNALSYAQWTVEEMVSGECWEHARYGANV